MKIIQLSDLHFHGVPSTNQENIANCLLEYLKTNENKGGPIVCCICGDVIYQGNTIGYNFAKEFLQKLSKQSNSKIKFVICPGNHDILVKSPEEGFSKFNQFCGQLTGNWNYCFGQETSCISTTIGDTDFISVNSSFHKDHKFGMVEIEQFSQILARSKSQKRVVILHHHLIPIRGDNSSHVKNSYEFIHHCLSRKTTMILHGHRHMNNYLPLGKARCRVIGVGSLFFKGEDNINNQFNIIDLSAKNSVTVKNIKFIADSHKAGRIGNFQEFTIKEA